MNDPIDGRGIAGKVKRAVVAVGGATVAEVLGNALTSAPAAQKTAQPPAGQPHVEPAHAEQAPEAETGGHEWVPESETSTVTQGPDGSVDATTGTVWRPEGAETEPDEDDPIIEEFEEIHVTEDAFGNFIIDAVERVIVHDHGHDEVYEERQHLVIPGDGTPGDTDLDIIEREDVVVHENADGTISVEQHGSLSVEVHPDAPGHGDIEISQVETVLLDEAPTGPPGIDVEISEDELATTDDPFGEPATIRQEESVGGKVRTGTVTTTTSVPAPLYRQPSTVDTVTSSAPAVAAETTQLAVTTSLVERTAPVKHAEPVFAKHPEPVKHPDTVFAKHSEPVNHADPVFGKEAAGHHDAGELGGPPPPLPEPHPVDAPQTTIPEPPQAHVEERPRDVTPQEHETPLEEHHPALDVPEHQPFHQAHADGGG